MIVFVFWYVTFVQRYISGLKSWFDVIVYWQICFWFVLFVRHAHFISDIWKFIIFFHSTHPFTLPPPARPHTPPPWLSPCTAHTPHPTSQQGCFGLVRSLPLVRVPVFLSLVHFRLQLNVNLGFHIYSKFLFFNLVRSDFCSSLDFTGEVRGRIRRVKVWFLPKISTFYFCMSDGIRCMSRDAALEAKL